MPPTGAFSRQKTRTARWNINFIVSLKCSKILWKPMKCISTTKRSCYNASSQMAAEPFSVTCMYDTGRGWTLQQLATTGCTYQEKMSFIILIVNSWCSLHVMWARQLSQYHVWLRAGRPDDWGSIPSRGERIFLLASVSTPPLGSTHPPVQWVPGVLPPELKHGQGMTLTTLTPSRAKVKNKWELYLLSPPSTFMACSGTAY
jgi:hypothetical protein